MFRVRAITAFILVCVMMLGVGGRYFYLQVLNYNAFATRSEANRVALRVIAPTRGQIYERNGLAVAENVPAYRLVITPEQVQDLDATLAGLRRLVALSPEDIERFRERLKLTREYQAIPLRSHLSDAEVARFAVNRHRFPSADVVPYLTRHYPLGKHLAHVVGYTGLISKEELRKFDPEQYNALSIVGKTGLEAAFEKVLHGQVGYEKVEVNAQGRTLRVLERTDPVPGKDLYLHLDAGLQVAARAAFEGYAGAVVALDPATGAVLAMVSVPSFDPNLFVQGISSKAYQALRSSPKDPLFSRALLGEYPPGSTFKPFMGLAGLELGVRDLNDTIYCPGYYQLPGEERHYRDWKHQGHGWVDLARSITESCDVYYYTLAVEMGIQRIHDYLDAFGFGQPTGIVIGPENEGLLPSPAWKRGHEGLPWYPGETVITGIGQGFTLVTPLQLAVATATLASRGQRYVPRLVATMGHGENQQAVPPLLRAQVEIRDPSHWEAVVDAMEGTVNDIHGTAHNIATDEYRIAGKTGTAQVYGMPQDLSLMPDQIALQLRDHALFIAFAPADAPQIAVAVLVAHGESGGRVAAPIAKQVIDAFLMRSPDTAEPES